MMIPVARMVMSLYPLLLFQQVQDDRYSQVQLTGSQIAGLTGASEAGTARAVLSPTPNGTISATNLRHKVPREALKLLERGHKRAARGGLSDFEAAATDLERAVAIDPDYGDAHGELGVQYFHLVRLREAADEFRTALRLDPESSNWQSDLGWILFTLGDLPEAQHWARRALYLKVDNLRAHLLLGVLLAGSAETRAESMRHLADVIPRR
jgi:tetratricopeptide (TPR) repeat protein